MGYQHEHKISRPGPRASNAKLGQIILDPSSELGKLASAMPDLERTVKGYLILCLSEYHSEAVNNGAQTMAEMEKLGYKIIGRSPEGIIEIVEDKHGNILFQLHPKGLVIYRNEKNNYNSKAVQASIKLMTKLFADFIL